MMVFFVCHFAPIAYENADHSLTDVYGAPWDHTAFQPLLPAGSSREKIDVVFTFGSSEEYKPEFSDAQDWQKRNGCILQELNHFVSMSSDNTAGAHA